MDDLWKNKNKKRLLVAMSAKNDPILYTYIDYILSTSTTSVRGLSLERCVQRDVNLLMIRTVVHRNQSSGFIHIHIVHTDMNTHQSYTRHSTTTTTTTPANQESKS